MNKEQVLALMAERGDPCVTVHCTLDPVDRAGTRLRLKNLLRSARERIARDHGPDTAEHLGAVLEKLADEAGPASEGPGLVLLVSAAVRTRIDLPFAVRDQFLVESTFHTRELVRALGWSTSCHVLVLDRDTAHLLGVHDQHITDPVPGFPISNDLHPRDRLDGTMRTPEDQLKEFFNRVDKIVSAGIGSTAQLVLACVREHEALYRSICDHPERLIGLVAGAHHQTPPHELGRAVHEVMRTHRTNTEAEALHQLDKSGPSRTSTDPHDIWRKVRQGQGLRLFVEQDLRIPVLLDARAEVSSDTLPVTDDLVDELIEEQVRHGGEVIFLPTGRLRAHGGIALITRY